MTKNIEDGAHRVIWENPLDLASGSDKFFGHKLMRGRKGLVCPKPHLPGRDTRQSSGKGRRIHTRLLSKKSFDESWRKSPVSVLRAES